MKKIVFLSFIILLAFTSKVKAQSCVDTLAVLQTIVANKSSYIGQPFSVLESQLPIAVKNFLPIPMGNKRYEERNTSFSFFYSQDVNRTYPRLSIIWQVPLNQSLSYSLWGQTSGAWTSIHSAHYANAVIKDIGIIK
ncbi:MAG: hypothetical protein H7Y86_10350 [Rhizobacter sp.]|nr:hypothetical protein [Ferruginibacter sp.]